MRLSADTEMHGCGLPSPFSSMCSTFHRFELLLLFLWQRLNTEPHHISDTFPQLESSPVTYNDDRHTTTTPCTLMLPDADTIDLGPPTNWNEFIDTLPEWERDLLQYTEDVGHKPQRVEEPNATQCNLKDILQERRQMHLVTDGGAEAPNRGSFGWVIATHDKILWKGKGYARGYPMDSHRSEGYGRLAAITFMIRYQEFIGGIEPLPCLVSHCDNKAIVNQSKTAWSPWYKPSKTTVAGWDVIA